MERTQDLVKELRIKLQSEMQSMHDRLSKCEMRVDVHHQKITKADDFLPLLRKLTEEFNLR
jgi:hypothetical protein